MRNTEESATHFFQEVRGNDEVIFLNYLECFYGAGDEEVMTATYEKLLFFSKQKL